MSLSIQLTSEMEARLREKAAAQGKDPVALALEAVTERLAAPDDFVSPATAEERLEAWNRFAASMREHARNLPPGHLVDDSRESIYEGRGE